MAAQDALEALRLATSPPAATQQPEQQQPAAATASHAQQALEAALSPQALTLDQLCEAMKLAATCPPPPGPPPRHPQQAQHLTATASQSAFPSRQWMAAAMQEALRRCEQIDAEEATGMTRLARLAWAASELHCCAALRTPMTPAGASSGHQDQGAAVQQQDQHHDQLHPQQQPPPAVARAVASKMLGGIEAGGFLAPDFCRVLCALGSLGWRPDNHHLHHHDGKDGGAATQASTEEAEAVREALLREVQVQLREFLSDFTARDVALLAMGLADTGLLQQQQQQQAPLASSSSSLTSSSSGAAAAGGAGGAGGAAQGGAAAALQGGVDIAELRARLMKAVYSKVRTIEDKAAVDFALSRLESDAKSMHYDPRWTHEELGWLPGHERDKRRIIKENYYRNQWGGWA